MVLEGPNPRPVNARTWGEEWEAFLVERVNCDHSCAVLVHGAGWNFDVNGVAVRKTWQEARAWSCPPHFIGFEGDLPKNG